MPAGRNRATATASATATTGATATAAALTTALATALAPVRDALLAAARDDAEQIEALAVQAASRRVAEAEASAEHLRAEARAQGAAQAAAALADRRVRAGRQARTAVLAARRDEYERLREAARAAVTALADDPEYPAIRARLADQVRQRLGAEADVRDAPGGGVIAMTPGRRLDYSFTAYVDRAVDVVAAGLDAP